MSEPLMNRLMLLSAGVLLAVAAFRWHEAAAAAPDRIRGADGSSAVLVVQTGDCPLRRAAMMRWLVAFQETVSGSASAPVSLAVLRDGPGAVDDRLTSLPRLGASDTRSAARAVLRAGVPGTPAVVLLDPDGDVLLADTFAPDGVGSRFLAASSLLREVTRPDLPPSSMPRDR